MLRTLSLMLLVMSMPVTAVAQQTVKLPARDKILSDRPAVVYAIGKEDGEDWEILSGVIAAEFDARDNLYVLDSNNFRVLVFDASGKFVRRISQRGEGPGELMVPTGMTVMIDGTIVVSDGSRHAYSLFKSDGTFLYNVPYGDREGVGGRSAFAATADFGLDGLHRHPRGGVVAQVSTRAVRNPDQLGAPTGERKVPVKWIDLSTRNGKSTVLYELTLPSLTPRVTPATGRGVSVTTMPPNWTPSNTIGVLPSGGVVIAHEADYRVKVVSPAGKLERIIERPIAPRKGTPQDKASFIEHYLAAFAESATQMGRPGNAGSATASRPPREQIKQLLDNATWLEVVPVLRRVTADPQGRIWVARTPTDFGPYGPIDLLRADGAYIGTIARSVLPAAVSSSGRAAFIERDEFGVEHITVKQLPAAWR